MKFVAPKNLSKGANAVHKRLLSCRDKKYANVVKCFFKTGPGEYGEGDEFLGIKAPVLQKITKDLESSVSLEDTKQLIQSPYHEQRYVALGIIRKKYEAAVKPSKLGLKKKKKSTEKSTNSTDGRVAKRCFDMMKGLIVPYANNWDLIDCFVPHVIGHYLLSRPKPERKFLYAWAQDKSVWKRRSAVLSTWAFIRVGEYTDALALCKMLLSDDHDLMHKSTGWMLREIGRNEGGSKPTLKQFLKDNVGDMPRTMLRYSIEHLDSADKTKWMQVPSNKKGCSRKSSD